MNGPVFIDTGPIVAIFNARDSEHHRAADTLKTLTPPLLTTWPVLTEAAYLLRGRIDLVLSLLNLVDGGWLRVVDLSTADLVTMTEILQSYRDQGFQLADVSLMHLAVRRDAPVFTFDLTDFSISRTPAGHPLNLIGALA